MQSPEPEADNKPDRIGIWKCWFLRRGENWSTRRKTSRGKEECRQQTQPTYATGSGIRTQDTLVGGERSCHCAIPTPQYGLQNVQSLRDILNCSIAWGGVLPYMGHIGMCCCEGYGFQAVYSSIGYIKPSVWV